MTFAEVVAKQLARIPSVRAETAVFLGMAGTAAKVRIGGNEVVLPFVGTYEPVVGQTVQVEWRDGAGVVIGAIQPRPTRGVVTAVNSPNVTVEIGGMPFFIPTLRSYTPAVGDNVVVMWGELGGVCFGTTDQAPPPPPQAPPPAIAPPPAVVSFDITVRATDSGRYQTSWWSNDPRASNNNRGIWVYGAGIRDALAGWDSIDSIEILLPLRQEVGQAQIGLAHHSSIPGGAPTITDTIDLPRGRRSGWQPLPAGWGGALASGDRGIGVTAVGGGDTIWAGTRSDPASGQLRFRGTR